VSADPAQLTFDDEPPGRIVKLDAYVQRNAEIFVMKQQGATLKLIAAHVGLGTSRVGQILQQTAGATSTWCCPLCGNLVASLGAEGWCLPCEDNEARR
jgi:hypothetical protein